MVLHDTLGNNHRQVALAYNMEHHLMPRIAYMDPDWSLEVSARASAPIFDAESSTVLRSRRRQLERAHDEIRY